MIDILLNTVFENTLISHSKVFECWNEVSPFRSSLCGKTDIEPNRDRPGIAGPGLQNVSRGCYWD